MPEFNADASFPSSTAADGVISRNRLPRPRRPFTLSSVVLLAIFAGSAKAEDLTCRKGSDVRRVQLLTADNEQALPCEVVLWTSPTDQRQLWRAEFERGFCAAKHRELKERMRVEGWRCLPTPTEPSEVQQSGQRAVM